jgi:hypothetical protein
VNSKGVGRSQSSRGVEDSSNVSEVVELSEHVVNEERKVERLVGLL